MKMVIALTFLLFLSGCAGLFQNRSFISEMDHQYDDFFVPGEDFDYIPGDTGVPYRSREQIRKRTPASESESFRRNEYSSLTSELQSKERKLSLRERELYREVKPYLESDSEKIYFLSLHPRERMEYLDSRRIKDSLSSLRPYENQRTRTTLSSLEPLYTGDLYLGMSKVQVIDMWGRPARIEVAGNPSNENEKWAFYENGRVKFVYFEGGTVQGWQIQ